MEISKKLQERLGEDRKEFQRLIGGKIWTIEDTIWEFIKMAGKR